MSSMGCVSVVMAFLNEEAFIAEAIESVMAQTYADWELILVDDGSSDRSAEIARRYAEARPDRIRYLRHPDNAWHGISGSRNVGLKAARGGLVAFLDADDVYLPERLQKHMELLERWPQAAMVQSCLVYWHSWRDGTSERLPDSSDVPPPVPLDQPIGSPWLLLMLLDSGGATEPGVCSVTVRRNVALQVGGFVESFDGLYDDQVFLTKLYLQHWVLVTAGRLALYRQHPTSMLHIAAASGEYTPGQPHEARGVYLEWIESYLRETGTVDPRIYRSLRNQLLPYRHPVRWRLQTLPDQVARLVRPVARSLLPKATFASLDQWRGHMKEARARRRAERQATLMSSTDEVRRADQT